MKLVHTNEAVMEVQEREGGKEKCGYGDALGTFRNEFYADFPIHIITLPEVIYDSKNDRYTLKFTVKNSKHTLKCSNEVAEFITGNLSLAGNIYYGFRMKDGIVIEAAAEVW